ncbi:hypothetical protein DIT71_16115 [Marinobacter vulgaris]|uniref:Uncharacterized protein n=1 Tax=Marinobacter vulgaris TaxID=1928331 RepID=A0A2V3ZUQ8_9GAMM|nr:hypothetical protein [Marinobacter vulgaris]PXX89101.1 hypothetical protein DIT71_16115 [Marinobacter vulgaris]TSJ67457.1 hypothetical protein FPC41_16455 [Marinobacter vulgaris]
MSLLTSLIKASTQFQQALEKRPPSASGNASAKPDAPDTPTSATDDRFTLSERATVDTARPKSTRLSMAEYKQTVGQDLAYMRETLRHKLAEYKLNPATSVEVSKSDGGTISLGGKIPEQTRSRIEQDLNNSKPFREAFSRLSASEPTLHFVDNALKLNKAYGVNNSLLDTLVSDNQQFNGLQDLAHRYDSMRQTISTDQAGGYTDRKNFALSLNTRA